jgi:hypothetical protein
MSTAPGNGFSFGGYTVRAVNEKDRPYLEQLIAADPYHRDILTADFFLKLTPGEDSWALEDGQGTVVFYFKTTTAVRIAIQFPPTLTRSDRYRHAEALEKGMRWIGGLLAANKFHEVLFDTDGPELRQFAKQRLGFEEASLLVRTLKGTSEPPRMPPTGLGTVPTSGQEGTGDAHVRP